MRPFVFTAVVPRESGVSSTPRLIGSTEALSVTGSPAFAGDDDLCAWAQNARTILQTLLRPRAHRAVGRWPPVSRAGRRVEKNVFPMIAGVKALQPLKVKETRGKMVFSSTWTIDDSLAETRILRPI